MEYILKLRSSTTHDRSYPSLQASGMVAVIKFSITTRIYQGMLLDFMWNSWQLQTCVAP